MANTRTLPAASNFSESLASPPVGCAQITFCEEGTGLTINLEDSLSLNLTQFLPESDDQKIGDSVGD